MRRAIHLPAETLDCLNRWRHEADSASNPDESSIAAHRIILFRRCAAF
jgi:hypothetical protein